MATEKHLPRLARAELTQLGWASLTDPVGTFYTINQLRFCVFTDKDVRWSYITALYRLGERRKVRSVPQFATEEHTRRLRKWCREQIVLPITRRSPVMVRR